jgi:ABC-2 type transport system permease protein
MSAEAVPTTRTATAARRARRPGVGTVYRWELRKLRIQKRTYLGLGAALAVPVIFVVALLLNPGGGPDDVPFGRYVRESGLAVPLVSLSFGSIWLMPLITALVGGDIVAAEDHNGTLKTILTRSAERWQVFAGKALAALTYALLALALYVGISLVLGSAFWGLNSVTSLSGTVVHPGRGLLLLAGGTLTYFLPLAAVACIALLLSTVTRNSAAAVTGTLMVSIAFQLLGIISALDFLRPYLLSEQFNAWQGLLRDPADWAPVVRAAWVSGIYALIPLAAAFVVFIRRDVTGG